MKVIDILNSGKPTLSLEVFPPKEFANYESVREVVTKIAEIQPAFMSVTYGAGGGTSDYTASLAKEIQGHGVTALAHLSCVSSDKTRVQQELVKLKKAGIENILALRGDIPAGLDVANLKYHYASELAEEIRRFNEKTFKEEGDAKFSGFCIGGACYPEGHPESPNIQTDIDNLLRKVEAGCDFLTTQMFFDNNVFYNFLYKIRDRGIKVPVVAGIMPVTNGKQMSRIMKLSGAIIPQRFRAIVDRFGDTPAAMTQAGVAFATEQVIDLLANGVNNIHIYTMNKPQVARQIRENLSEIIQ